MTFGIQIETKLYILEIYLFLVLHLFFVVEHIYFVFNSFVVLTAPNNSNNEIFT
jgi:hypothetical protein